MHSVFELNSIKQNQRKEIPEKNQILWNLGKIPKWVKLANLLTQIFVDCFWDLVNGARNKLNFNSLKVLSVTFETPREKSQKNSPGVLLQFVVSFMLPPFFCPPYFSVAHKPQKILLKSELLIPPIQQLCLYTGAKSYDRFDRVDFC